MAYLDLQERYATAVELPQGIRIERDHGTDFSALEWNVIALARRDTLASLSEPGAVSRAFGGLFGLSRASRLADGRLESVRRLAVHAWHRGYALPVSELAAFVNAGFTMDQAETLLASVTGARASRQGRRAA